MGKYGLDNRYFKDEPVFDLVNFIYLRGNSSKRENWYSELERFGSTSLYSLFDDDQKLEFEANESYITLAILDNNKLLIICDTEDERRTLFGYVLHTYADAIEVNISDKTISLNNEFGLLTEYEKDSNRGLEKLPNKFSIKDYVRPVSYQQLYERGQKELTK